MKDERTLRRWLSFNAVGLAGMAVQLATLAWLVHLGLHYLPATALAVEAALLHNFAWHQRWTWRDRPAASRRGVAGRLVRFHLLNGSVSLSGNLGLMAVLAGRAGIDPVLASLAAIAACSVVNFAGSDALVFPGPARRWGRATALLVCLSLAPLHAAGDAAAPAQRTLAAWHAYERALDDRYQRGAGDPFFAHDRFAAASPWRERALSGGTPMLQIDAARPGAPPAVPDGTIHHWAGAIFVPRLTVSALLDHLESHAGRESDAFEDVLASKLLARDGDRLRVFLKLRRTKVITATYNTEHSVEYRRLSATRASARSAATKIAELADAGTPAEREKRQDEDSGYLWRLNAYWRYEQVDGGILVECESVSLSRGVPTLLRPFIGGIVDDLARESLDRTLSGLRRSLAGARPAVSAGASPAPR